MLVNTVKAIRSMKTIKIECVSCGADNQFSPPEMNGQLVKMVRWDNSLGRGVCDSKTCRGQIAIWDGGDKSVNLSENYAPYHLLM